MESFGLLTFIEDAGVNRHGKTLWRMRCTCGAETVAIASQVRTGKTKSCGHLKSAGNRRTHGKHGSRLYNVWGNMKARCDNPAIPSYKNYGGRGITYCPEWADFSTFAKDVGEPPTDKHTLDRIDNDGNYDSENTRWVLRDVQSRNTRQNVWVVIGDETKCLYDWCEQFGISAASVYSRMKRKGMDIVAAITTEKAERFRKDTKC